MAGGRGSERRPIVANTQVGALVTRAVMLDVAAAKGTPMLDVGYEITGADLEAAMKRQNVSIGRGDAV